MRLKTYFIEKYLEDVHNVPTLLRLKGDLLKDILEAAQDSGETYEIETPILGKHLLNMECPLTVTGFAIMPGFIIMAVRGQKSVRIQAKWSRIAEEVLGVPIDLSWEHQVMKEGDSTNVAGG